jgi:hypothetical protein
MSSRYQLRAATNRTNALKSTNPKPTVGKQRSSMNACKHNLTGAHLALQPHELDSYNRLTASLLADLQPGTELERQAAQKIIDTHFRLNRLAGLENNIFHFGTIDNSTATPHDDRIEVMIAQTRAWIERSGAFDVLGRYEARLARQVVKFTLEFERLQTGRERREWIQSNLHPGENERDNFDLASFGRNTPDLVMRSDSWRVLSHLPRPEPAPETISPEIPSPDPLELTA